MIKKSAWVIKCKKLSAANTRSQLHPLLYVETIPSKAIVESSCPKWDKTVYYFKKIVCKHIFIINILEETKFLLLGIMQKTVHFRI